MKKIAMIIPSLLLTSCLFGCGNKEVDPFVIASEEKFNDAISFKGVKHLQAARLVVNYTDIHVMNMYAETCMSPKIYYAFERYIVDTPPTPPSQKYVEKTSSGEYYRYVPQTGTEEWKQEHGEENDFRTPTKEGEDIASILAEGSVDYNFIKDSYDKERQAYYFKVKSTTDVDYDTIMSFYNNRLVYFSYCNYDETSPTTKLTIFNYTYGTINPTLPPYDPIEP